MLEAMPRRYWLMKCEPAAYTIDDLARDGRTSWEGVRNYQARNFMRDEMQVGDGVLFYASNADPSGVTGLAEIVRAGYPDHFAWTRGHKYSRRGVERGDARLVHGGRRVRRALPRDVPLDVLKSTKGLESMMVTQKGSRLSVQPATKQEYDIVARLGRTLAERIVTSPRPTRPPRSSRRRSATTSCATSARRPPERAPRPVPDVAVLESLINAAFWTSLRREEGFVPKMSLAYVPPADNGYAMRFEQPMLLTPHDAGQGGAGRRARRHPPGRVGATDGDLYAWGTTRSIPPLGLVIEIVEPALLVVKHHRGEKTGKYVNVAVLEGDQVKLVDETASSLPDCPALVGSLLGFDSPSSWLGSMNVLVQLAVSMRAHGRGGLLLVVPSTSETWRDSMVAPMAYAISPPYRGLGELLRDGGPDRQTDRFQQALREVVDVIAGLTAVDGAAVMTDTYELLAFGAKIARRRGSPQVEQVTVTEPVVGGEARTVTPAQLGGTRHLSAAQFVHDQRDAIALVASQDRRFTVFAWSPCADQVHGHQVETLLL